MRTFFEDIFPGRQLEKPKRPINDEIFFRDADDSDEDETPNLDPWTARDHLKVPKTWQVSSAVDNDELGITRLEDKLEYQQRSNVSPSRNESSSSPSSATGTSRNESQRSGNEPSTSRTTRRSKK